MKEYIDREAACAYRPPEKRERRYSTYNLDDAFEDGYDEHIKQVEAIPAADVVEVKLLEDGTLVVTTDKYPNVTRVFVEDGKTSGSLFYADEV